MPPNILFIMSDQHTPSVMGCHGDSHVITPNMDELAANGVVFDNAYCNNPVCVPSRMSFLTGLHSHHIDVWHNGDALPPQLATWPLVLRLAGYETVISGRNHLLWGDRLAGFGERLCGDYGKGVPCLKPGRTQQGTRGPQGIDGDVGEVETSLHYRVDEEACAHAEGFLRANRSDPFALFVGFYHPHAPFQIVKKYLDLYDGFEPDPHMEEAIDPVYLKQFETLDLGRGLDPKKLSLAIKTYYAMVTHVDELIGRLVATLKETGQLENTIVVYTSDHGELLGRHRLWHKMNFYEDSVRVPMIVMNRQRYASGRRVKENVSLLDCAPTLLDFAGYEKERPPFDGESFAPALEDVNWTRREPVIAESIGVERGKPGLMIKQGSLKLIMYRDTPPIFFDLDKDPLEHENMAQRPEYESVIEEMKKAIPPDWDPEAINEIIERNLKHVHFQHLAANLAG